MSSANIQKDNGTRKKFERKDRNWRNHSVPLSQFALSNLKADLY